MAVNGHGRLFVITLHIHVNATKGITLLLENRGKYLEYTLTTENMIYIYGIYIYTTVAIKIVDLPSNLPSCY